MDKNHFRLDGLEPTWEAVRFGEPWNGWLTPVGGDVPTSSIGGDAPPH